MTPLRLKILPCPVNRGKHPFHDSRWIASEGTEIVTSPYVPTDWTTREGFLVAEMRDIDPKITESIVECFNDYARIKAELTASRELLRQFKEVAEEYHKELDELTHVIGLTPISGNFKTLFKTLQEHFNSARKLILAAKLEALNQNK